MPLKDKKGLIIGIANSQSVAYGCAEAFVRAGASLAVTYLNSKAEPYVRPLAERLECPIIVPCDVREPGQLEAVFTHIRGAWGRLDFVFIPSPSHRRKICTAVLWTARRQASPWRWMSRATLSYA